MERSLTAVNAPELLLGWWKRTHNMRREIKESDWKVPRRLHPLLLERFCECVLAAIEHVKNDNALGFHQR